MLPVTFPVTAPAIGPTKLVAVTVVPTTVLGTLAPTWTLSAVPPLISAVVATNVVNVPAAAEAPPTTAPSIVPPLISIPTTGVVPPKMLSVLVQLAFNFVPHESSLAPFSGFVKP